MVFIFLILLLRLHSDSATAAKAKRKIEAGIFILNKNNGILTDNELKRASLLMSESSKAKKIQVAKLINIHFIQDGIFFRAEMAFLNIIAL
jgi:methyl coenzyme M reductase subunit C